jgi:DNA (cytosine-5)-methyltransferase 1
VKPRLLDLYCGAGGAAKGYQRAGFHVTGVDIEPQPNYCGDKFVQDDAMLLLADFARGRAECDYLAVHASPPCPNYSILAKNMGVSGNHPDLIGGTRYLLEMTGLPYVIENVVGSPLKDPIMLCGSSLGLHASGMDLHRHRLFELNWELGTLLPPCSRQHAMSMGVYGNGTNKWHRDKLGRNLTVAEQREAMGIDWMARDRLSQAIPPAYTELLGTQLMAHLNAQERSAA